jgi:hypothetical protein
MASNLDYRLIVQDWIKRQTLMAQRNSQYWSEEWQIWIAVKFITLLWTFLMDKADTGEMQGTWYELGKKYWSESFN